MNYILNILFSSVKYNYVSELSAESINETITKKPAKKKRSFSSPYYQVIIEKDSFDFSIIVNRQGLPIKVISKVEQKDPRCNVTLELKPFISPLFILVPIWMFLYPMLFSETFILNGSQATTLERLGFSFLVIGFFTVLIIYFVHIPLSKEKKILESELKLKRMI